MISLKELESYKEYNELDMICALIDKAEVLKRRTEDVLRGTKQAGIEVRAVMLDLKLITDIVRDKILLRRDETIPFEDTKLHKAIITEKNRLEAEEVFIQKLEQTRKQKSKI